MGNARTVLTAFLFLAAALPAAAHDLHVFALVEGGEVTGEANFIGGGPLKEAPVQVHDAAGNLRFETRTDERGAFTFPAEGTSALTITCETSDGHHGHFTIPANELPAHETAQEPALGVQSDAGLRDLVAGAVAKQVNPLRAEIDRLRSQTRLRDVLGGIGYIFGVAGIVALLKARRRG
ncbi:MAG: cobalamin biosynthesis protein CbiL [Candidatus Hydrogenedentota bacterium]